MKKTKIALLGTLAGISAITPALTTISCGNSEPTVNKVGDNYDKEYGVDEAVFTKLKNSFPKAVHDKMKAEGGYTEEQITKAMNNARNACAAFDKEFRSRNDLSYTTITSSLIEYASRACGVKLVREFSRKAASWDELDVAFNGMKDSMKSYMESTGVLSKEERERILNNAQAEYDEDFKPSITEKGKRKYDDPLLAVTRAKSDLFRLFSDVNEDIGLLASNNRLKDFLTTHKVEYVFDENNDSNKLDKLETNSWFKEGADLSIDSRILQIFTITREGDEEPLTEFISDKVCPGYTIIPKLKRINKNARTNEYSLDIDWTCTKTSYVQTDPAKAERTTAHYYNGKTNVDPSDTTSLYKMLKEAGDEAYVNYPIYLTKEGEKNALIKEYFTEGSQDGYITFGWDDDADKNAFEALFSGAKANQSSNDASDYQYIIDSDALAKAGLKVKWNGVPNNDDPETPMVEGRLSDFMAVKTPRNEESSRLDDADNTTELMKDFLDNCTTWAYVKPQTTEFEEKYSSHNTVYVNYENSLYTASSNGEDSYKGFEGPCNNLFKVSQEAYDYLTTEFNQRMDFLEGYTKNEYQDEYDAAYHDVVVESIMFTLTVLFTAQTTAMCWVPVFAGHLPLYMLLLALSWASLGGQAAILGLLVDKKLKPLEDMKDDCNDVKNSAPLKNLITKVKASQNNNHLCRYNDDKVIKKADYNKGFADFLKKTDFFGENGILESMEFYQKFGTDTDYVNFLSVLQQHNIRPQDYESKMSTWDSNGVSTKLNWGLLGTTFALDMACLFLLGPCPEMTDWQLCKAVAAEARATGKSVRSLYPIYKKLKQVKDSLLKMSQEIEKLGAGAVGSLSKVTAKEVNSLIMNSKDLTTGYRKLQKYGKQALDTLDFVGQNSSSFTELAEKTLQLIKDEKSGMAVFARIIVTDSSGKISQAGEEILQGIFKNFGLILAKADPRKIPDSVGLLQNLYNLIHKGINAEGLAEIERLTAAGILALRGCAPNAALNALKQMESVLMDSRYFVEDIETIMNSRWFNSGNVIKCVRVWLEDAYDNIVRTFIGTAGFLIS